jgi:hypothetical protein
MSKINLTYIYYLLGGLALLYLACYSTYEHMTNSDVQKHLDHHSKSKSSSKSGSKEPLQKEEIMGPTTPDKGSSHPDPDSGNPNSKPKVPKTGVYPDIYGPEVLLVPGHKDQHQDSHNPEPYDFVPAAEFPAGPNAPSPFLTDFSRLLKT